MALLLLTSHTLSQSRVELKERKMYVTLKQKRVSMCAHRLSCGSFFFVSFLLFKRILHQLTGFSFDIFMDGGIFFLCLMCRSFRIYTYVLACEIINTELLYFFLWLFFVSWSEAIFWFFFSQHGIAGCWRCCGIVYDFFPMLGDPNFFTSTSAPSSYAAQLLLMLCFFSVISSRWCVLHKHGLKCRWMNFQFGLLGLRVFFVSCVVVHHLNLRSNFISPDVDSMFDNFTNEKNIKICIISHTLAVRHFLIHLSQCSFSQMKSVGSSI